MQFHEVTLIYYWYWFFYRYALNAYEQLRWQGLVRWRCYLIPGISLASWSPWLQRGVSLYVFIRILSRVVSLMSVLIFFGFALIANSIVVLRSDSLSGLLMNPTGLTIFALRKVLLSECAVTNIMGTSMCLLIAMAASMPSAPSPSQMSINTRSGTVSRAILIASLAVEATPAT